MIPDHQTDIVYISDRMRKQYPDIDEAMRSALGGQLRFIHNTNDIWVRDFMPIEINENQFVQFRYDPDYLKDDPELRTENACRLLPLTQDCVQSDLVIDGGNIVRWSDAAIMTDKIYCENPGMDCQLLQKRLRELLQIDRLFIVPKEPYDCIGHADGMVRFVNDRTLLVNDYSKCDPRLCNPSFGRRLAEALPGFALVPFPYCPVNEKKDGIDSAKGVYINFLQIRNMILLPVFGMERDDAAEKILTEMFPQSRIITVPSNKLAHEGGVLNCVTWNIKTRVPAPTSM